VEGASRFKLSIQSISDLPLLLVALSAFFISNDFAYVLTAIMQNHCLWAAVSWCGFALVVLFPDDGAEGDHSREFLFLAVFYNEIR
jgi:hypothetical protein